MFIYKKTGYKEKLRLLYSAFFGQKMRSFFSECRLRLQGKKKKGGQGPAGPPLGEPVTAKLSFKRFIFDPSKKMIQWFEMFFLDF